ncbi:hypothetical protein A0J61_11051 [Choanephora cucurbitarum]|uniref:Integrase catalytic domain-containing protein n=1 Tax=Choanephora cucurbitarum TaxID=101091 RepID=A0A1C7MVQ8_9FUNG|nr:hypothetical protein A0J61_11051 [Choanephora cucurbitarum]
MDYPTYIALFNYITRKTYPIDSTETIKASLRKKSKKFIAERGRLYEKAFGEDGREYLGRELLHEGNIDQAITKVHSEGHFGINNTWKKVHLKYVGKKIYERVVDNVKTCITCQARQRIPHLKTTPGFLIPTPSRPFYLVGTDCVGPLEITPEGNKYIMVASCYLTRWPVAAAVPDITAETTERFLTDHIVSLYGVPTFLLTDRGSNYMAEYIQVFLKKIECTHRKTTSRRPNSNGHVERLNQTLIQTIAKLKREEGNKPWDRYVTAALMCIRTMVNEATGFSPSMLLYGYEMRTPSTWVPPRYDYVLGEIQDEIARRAKEIETWVYETRREAKEKAEEKKKMRKLIYDRTVVPREPFKINDKVLMKDHYPKDKFADHYIGPLTVIKHNAPTNTYHLVGPNYRRIEHAVHGDILLPFKESKRMIPDVMVTRAMNQFQSWLDKQRYE